MKGLTQFITDLRNSKDQDEETKKINLEITNIRDKFKTSLNGYQKKKYVCKLIYVYLLGNIELYDFGLKESFDLLRSSVYSEKQLGYLAVSVLLNNKRQKPLKDHMNYIVEMVHSDLIKDIQSTNEEFNCLAIQFIASTFSITGTHAFQIYETDPNSDKWLELIDMTYSSVSSPVQKPIVRRKAAIALKVLLELYPDVILTNSNWVPRLLKLVDDQDISTVISSIPLLQFVLQLKPQFGISIVPSISQKLHNIIIENKCPPQYYYYNSPAPWLIVKLFQFMEQLFLLTDKGDNQIISVNSLDEQTVTNLRQSVARSIQNASQPIKGVPNRNSQSSILFQAVSLAVFLEASPEAINGAMNALLMLLTSNETNTRYLSLDALIKLTARSNSTFLSSKEKFDEILPMMLALLRDRDISVRRKTLDLLYTICTFSNFTTIISKLLEYFPSADFALKSELAIKIAHLAEKFATDSTWYVTTMLKLLSIGGGSNSNDTNYIGNEVWERIVQIVVNNDDLQKKTAKLIINLVKRSLNKSPHDKTPTPPLSESLIKVAAFVLGEYGDQIIDIEELNAKAQFQLLYEAYFKVSLITRSMILSTFLKFVVKFPDEPFVPDIVDLFEIETQSIDLEIQTRAYEYLKLVTIEPQFKLAESLVKRNFPIFNTQRESPLMDRLGSVQHIVGRNRSRSMVLAKNINNIDHSINNDEDETEHTNPFESETIALSPNWYAGYHRMLHYDAGIFYEDQLIKITYRVIKETHNITIKFTVINNSYKTVGTEISGFTILNLESLTKSQDPNYTLHIKSLPQSSIHDKTTMEIEVKVRNIVENNESPVLSMTFMCGGSFNHLNLKVPVLLLKTLSPTSLHNADEFSKRWNQIGDALGIEKGENKIRIGLSHRYTSSNISRLLSRIGFAVVYESLDTPDTPIRVAGAGILHTQKSNYGVLVSIAGIDDIGKELEITVRCTGGGLAEVVCSTLNEIFSGKL
ncbi:AP-2 complex subunit alpha [Spathaspora sp. JA1]|nr:AP-2 complex subunit alpha [Spathaspora sp. JA1]